MKKIMLSLILGMFLISFVSANLDLSNSELIFSEDFNVTPDKLETYQKDDTQKWRVENEELLLDDYNDSSGSMIYLINNETYSGEYTILVDYYRLDYFADWDSVGIIVGLQNETDYYLYSMSNYQNWFSHKLTSHSTESVYFKDNPEGLDFNKFNTMQINVYEDRVQLINEGVFIKELDISIPEGRIGLYLWDCSGQRDAPFSSITKFDNIRIYKPMNITISKDGDIYNATIQSEKNIKEIEFIVEEETTDLISEDKTIKLLEQNKITFNEEENITEINVTNEYSNIKPTIPNVIVRVYYKITDWFGGLFKSKSITI